MTPIPTTNKKCLNTVEIGGEVIARFVFSDDAVFFAQQANDHGMFELTNPGEKAVARNHKGDDL